MLAEGLETRYKSSISDVVSGADEAAERLVASRLSQLRPDDAVVGEEGAERSGGHRTWYIDPVDGTYNFLSRVPYWSTAPSRLPERSTTQVRTSCGSGVRAGPPLWMAPLFPNC